jgi:predicted nucleic acid-binding protein
VSDGGPILVDTSVWIDFFGPRPGPAGEELRRLIAESEPVVLTGIVVAEVLQGLIHSVDVIEKYLGQWELLALEGFEAYARAAKMFRVARSRGLTLTTVDALIAATALDYGARLFTLDRDFEGLAKLLPLKLYRPR